MQQIPYKTLPFFFVNYYIDKKLAKAEENKWKIIELTDPSKII